MPDQARLIDFGRALLSVLADDRSLPHIRRPRLRALEASEGGANHLLAISGGGHQLFLKLRVDPGDLAGREAWALGVLPPGIGPRLLAHLTPAGLAARAGRRRDLALLARLDLDAGGALLLERLPGQAPRLPISDQDLDLAVAAIARLHSCRPRRGPSMYVPSSPTALGHQAADEVDAVRRCVVVDEATERALRRALRVVERHLEHAWRAGGWARVRGLCHGDLRWHNLLRWRGEVRLLDLEHAGLGDPAVDLAMMASRTPLSLHDELRLLDGYCEATRARGFLDRYFTVRPVVALLGACGALRDLDALRRGARPAVGGALAHARRRAPMVLEEVREVLERLLAPTPLRSGPRLRARPRSTRVSTRVRWITVDGTAASFKSPLARALAARLGVPYFNSGAAYRYVALFAWCHALDPVRGEHQRRVIEHLRQARVRLRPDGALEVGGHRFEHSLGLAEVERRVADWASLPALRAALTPVWRAALRRKAGILEGRDAGSALAPAAQLKLFVDAPLALRAGALAERSGLSPTRARELLQRRDGLDRKRTHAPLQVPPGARRLRVSEDNIDRLVARLAADCEGR